MGSILELLGAQVGPKLAPRRLLPRHFCQKADFQKEQGKPMVFQCFCPLRWHLKRPKITPRRSQGGLKEVLFQCSKLSSILVPFGLHFGSLLGSLLGPKRVPKIDQIHIPDWWRLQEAPRRPQEAPREPQESPKRPQEGPKRALKRHQESPQEAPREPQEAPQGKIGPVLLRPCLASAYLTLSSFTLACLS